MDPLMSQTVDCSQCGAHLTFDSRNVGLTCPYCGHLQDIVKIDAPVTEQDLYQTLQQQSETAASEPVTGFDCEVCGAFNRVALYQMAGKCLYCDAPFVLEQVKTFDNLQPQGLLPFSISQEAAQREVKKWLKGLWFAPSKLKRIGHANEQLKGIYFPFWTFDANSSTYYEGQRGTYYYTTETYTEEVNGKSVRRTRQVRHTRWHFVSGRVNNCFDDVLVAANRGLPEDKLDALSPWHLDRLVPYQKEFIVGYYAQSYNVPLKRGFESAKQAMAEQIRGTINDDIGGDEQRISQMNPVYQDLTYKYILLPVWLSAFRYNNKHYQVLVNARTAEVQGERPYSWIKIAAAIIGGGGLVAGVWYWANTSAQYVALI